MRLKLVCFFLFYIACTLAENLDEIDNEDLNPISQTEEDAEDSDPSKRFLFGDDSTKYALEKHVRFRGGQKQILGYRPVKLQYLPVAQPLHNYKSRPMRVQGYNRHNLKQFRKPTVSLVPPKMNPLYKTLPANVPPSAPQKLSETQGWDVKPVYGPPGFNPSSPDPIPPLEPSLPINPIVPSTPVQPILPSPVQPVLPSPVQPVLPSPVQPVLPSPVQPSPVLPNPIQPIIPTAIPAHPHINVVPHSHPSITTVHFLPKPFVPLPVHPNLALPIPTPVLPPPQPSLIPLPTSVPIQPIHPPVLVQKPVVPINFIPGRHIPVPDLGVLPLGANVPIQVNLQTPHVVPKPVLIQHPQFIQRPLIQHQPPHVHVINKIPNVQLEGGFTPIQTNPLNHPEPNHIHFQHNVPQQIPPNLIHQVIPQPQLPIEPNNQPGFHNVQPEFHNIQPGFHNVQNGIHNVQTGFHNVQPGIQNVQPGFHNIQPNFNDVQPNFNNIQPNFDNIQPSNGQNPVPTDQSVHQEQPHNYFYFARRLPNYNVNNINNQLDFGQQQQPQINFDQHFHHANQQQEEPQQGYDENPGFYQPGNTDLQIPEYLPPHPHLRNSPQEEVKK